MKRVKHSYLWENGMVMTFDAQGNQIGELQSPHTPELEAKIREELLPDGIMEGFGGTRCAWPRGGFSNLHQET